MKNARKKFTGVDIENLSDDDIEACLWYFPSADASQKPHSNTTHSRMQHSMPVHKERDRQMTDLSGSFNGNGDDDDDDALAGAGEYDGEEVMGLNGLDEDEEEEEDEEDHTFDEARAAWGQKKSAYYDERKDGQAELEGDAAEEEEAEARRLQRLQAQDMEADDFASMIARGKADERSHGKGLTAAESKMMKSMDDDLRGITFSHSGSKKTKKGSEDEDENESESEEEEVVERNLDSLSKEEKLRIISEESPELVGLLEEFKTHSTEIALLEPLMNKLEEKQTISEGGRFLQYKYGLLVQYCMYVAFYLRLKSRGVSVKDHPVIEELLRLREILERIEPLEHKLRFQIALLMGDTDVVDEIPDESEEEEDAEEDSEMEDEEPEEVSEGESDEEDEESENEGVKRTGVYRALKGVEDGGEGEEEEDDFAEGKGQTRMSAERRRVLTQAINEISAHSHAVSQRREKRMVSGDQDVALPDPTKTRKILNQRAARAANASTALLKQQKKEEAARLAAAGKEELTPSQKRARERRRKTELAKLAQEELPEGEKRGLSYKISKNKGLVRERSTKNGTTSHSRMRSKYEKKAGFARKQVGGSVQDARDNYEGEASGIHPRIVRSTKY